MFGSTTDSSERTKGSAAVNAEPLRFLVAGITRAGPHRRWSIGTLQRTANGGGVEILESLGTKLPLASPHRGARNRYDGHAKS